jgi:putative addiction module component (TIGR02574 family)
MGNEARKLFEAALALPTDERAALAERIRASVVAEIGETEAEMYGATDAESEVEKAWADEITRRAERALRGESKGVPWENVRDEVRAMLNGK